jgi:hypothetical protein
MRDKKLVTTDGRAFNMNGTTASASSRRLIVLIFKKENSVKTDRNYTNPKRNNTETGL